MWRPTTRQARSVPFKFVSTILFHSASETSSVGVRLVMPAQFTSICTPPNAEQVALRSSLREDSSVTSQEISIERRPNALISCVAERASSGRRPVATTSAPAVARPFASARPMPLVPPITTAILLLRSSCGWPKKFFSRQAADKHPVIVCSPGRNFVTLKITTEDGVYGLGDATLNGRELAVASYLSDHVIPLLIGRDARRIEDIWQYLYKGAYWRRGPVAMCSIAAVDTALWDIKGKALNVPVYQLLGGASRDCVLVFGHANGPGIEEPVQAVAHYQKLGYKAIRAQCGIPGLQSTYGVGRGKMYYEPAQKDAPQEDVWSSELYMNFVPQLFARLRKEFGEDIPLLHDVHHRLTPNEAARVGKSLEPYHLFWLEDPTPGGFPICERLLAWPNFITCGRGAMEQQT